MNYPAAELRGIKMNFYLINPDAEHRGILLIKRKDGSFFKVQPVSKNKSPLNVKGIDLDLSATEIVDIVREVRER